MTINTSARNVEVIALNAAVDEMTGHPCNACFQGRTASEAWHFAEQLVRQLRCLVIVVDPNHEEWFQLERVYIDTPSEGDYGWETVGVTAAGHTSSLEGINWWRDTPAPGCRCCGGYHEQW